MQPFIPQQLPIDEIDWKSLIPLIGRANRALAHYDGILSGIPNPEVLLSPLTTQEAVLSSRIEGTLATLGEVYRFEAGDEPEEDSKRQDIGEILNYRKALRESERELQTRPFNLNLLLRLHSILLDSVRGRNMARGRFRSVQNWIGTPGTPVDQAVFVPPDPSHLVAHLGAWESYYHADEPDSLVQLAVIHAQFEILHPFMDGNGRLGRMLIPLFLFEKDILHRPTFYMSSWLEARREQYVAHLRPLGVEQGSWNRWTGFFLTGLEEQARANAGKARQILDLYQDLKQRVIDLTRSQYAVPLLDQLFTRPVFESGHLEFGERPPTRAAVASLLRTLREAEVIKPLRGASGRRPAIFAFADLINLCEGRIVL